MTDHLVEDDSQIAKDVLPVPTEEPAVPVELNKLKPWHLPRKQFIRERQWLYFAKRLIKNEKGSPGLPDQGEPEVRYLTLPGIDYLDARIIGHACNEFQCKLTTTGFLVDNDPNIARAKMREQALIDSGYISDKSFTQPSLFQDLADKNSQAYRDIYQKGPFHIVNVDACGSIAPPAAQTRRLIEAIHQLVTFQLAYKPGRWLFFLTTDARPDSVAGETVTSLWSTVKRNAKSDEEFRRKVLSLFGLPKDAAISDLHQLFSNPGEQFLRLFSLGFGKWLLHLAKGYSYRMQAHSAYCYSTTVEGDETPTMACLAFEFIGKEPNQPDPFGVARPDPQRVHAIDQGPSDSVRVAKKMGEMANLDLRMEADDHLRIEMTEATKSLLEEAGYPPEVLQQL